MTGKELLEKLQSFDEETLSKTVYHQDEYYTQNATRVGTISENWYMDEDGEGIAESDLTSDELTYGLESGNLLLVAEAGSIIIS